MNGIKSHSLFIVVLLNLNKILFKRGFGYKTKRFNMQATLIYIMGTGYIVGVYIE